MDSKFNEMIVSETG